MEGPKRKPEEGSSSYPEAQGKGHKQKVSYKAVVEEAFAEMRACIEKCNPSRQSLEDKRRHNDTSNDILEEEKSRPSERKKLSLKNAFGKYCDRGLNSSGDKSS